MQHLKLVFNLNYYSFNLKKCILIVKNGLKFGPRDLFPISECILKRIIETGGHHF